MAKQQHVFVFVKQILGRALMTALLGFAGSVHADGAPPAEAESVSLPPIPQTATGEKAVLAVNPAKTPAEGESSPAKPKGEGEPAAKKADAKSSDVTEASIQTRIKLVEENKEISADDKKKALELYSQSLDFLRSMQEWTTKIDEFQAEIDGAPAATKQLQEEIARTPVDADVPANEKTTLKELENRLDDSTAKLSEIEDRAARLKREPKRRANRRVEIPALVADAKQRIAEIQRAYEAGDGKEAGTGEVGRAKKMLLKAKRRAIDKEIEAYQKEIRFLDATGDLHTLRRDLTARVLAQTQKAVKTYQQLVNDRRRADADRASQQAKDAVKAAAGAHPVVRQLADDNGNLAQLRVGPQGLARSIEEASQKLDAVAKQLETVRNEGKNTRERLKRAEMTNAVGLLLRNVRGNLPDLRRLNRDIHERQQAISDVQMRWIEMEEQRNVLADVDSHVRAAIEPLQATTDPDELIELEYAINELYETRRRLLDDLISDYDQFFKQLVDLEARERELATQTAEFVGYIDERILWVRSAPPVSLADVGRTFESIRWFVDVGSWKSLFGSLVADLRRFPILYVLGVTILAALFIIQRRLRKALREIGQLAARNSQASFKPTLQALGLTALMSLVWPAILGMIAYRLATAVGVTEFVHAMGAGLATTALALWTSDIFRQTCRPVGLAEAHFGWKSANLQMIRSRIRWLMAVGLPMTFIVATVEQQSKEATKDSLGRFAFMTAMLALAWFFEQMLRPSGVIVQECVQKDPKGWAARLRHFWYALAWGTPLALAIVAGMGYYYTALQLAWRLDWTGWLALGAWLGHATVMRLLLVTRRRLAMEQARKKRQAALADNADGAAVATDPNGVAIDEPIIDLAAIDVQSRQLCHAVVHLTLLLGAWLIWVDVLPALGIFDKIEVWPTPFRFIESTVTTGGGAVITLADLGLATLIAVMTFLASKNIPGVLEMTILPQLPLDTGGRYAITTLSRHFITAMGLVMSAGVLGIGWANVQWLAAAVTFGLGFGLQEIFGNFISGLILLFERPIRIGDIVTVGDVSGTVTRIRIRATTITDWDRKDLIVPNKEFITGKVVNWTLTNRVLRMVINVGVAYGSNTELVRELLLKVVSANQYITNDPAPSVSFEGFGDSSLNFTIRAFVADLSNSTLARSEIHAAIEKELRQYNIEMPFPQRDLHLFVDEAEKLVDKVQDKLDRLPTIGKAAA